MKNTGYANTLVQGFAIFGEGHTETLYAVTDGGKIFRTGPHRVTENFDQAGREWIRVYDKPLDAEFIGNYPFPKIVTKWA